MFLMSHVSVGYVSGLFWISLRFVLDKTQVCVGYVSGLSEINGVFLLLSFSCTVKC